MNFQAGDRVIASDFLLKQNPQYAGELGTVVGLVPNTKKRVFVVNWCTAGLCYESEDTIVLAPGVNQ